MMRNDRSRGKPSSPPPRDVDDTARVADEDKLEAIRRQLDLEYGIQESREARRFDDRRFDDLRHRADRRVGVLVGGFVLGCVAAVVVVALFLRRADVPVPADVSTPAPVVAPGNERVEPSRLEPAPASSAAPREAVTASPPATPEPAAAPATRAAPAIPSSTSEPPPAAPAESITLPPPDTPRMPPPRLPENRRLPATPVKPEPGPTRSSTTEPALPPRLAEPSTPSAPPPPPASAREPRIASASPGMMRYTDPQRLFTIEYPAGWHVRAASSDTKRIAFYLDDPDEGIAMVLSRGTVPGKLRASALAPILSQRIRESYPDFSFTAMVTRSLPFGSEQSRVSAQWTNRWSQRMRAEGVIVSTPRGAETAYSYASGQAQELVYPGLEPTFQRMLESLDTSPRG